MHRRGISGGFRDPGWGLGSGVLFGAMEQDIGAEGGGADEDEEERDFGDELEGAPGEPEDEGANGGCDGGADGEFGGLESGGEHGEGDWGVGWPAGAWLKTPLALGWRLWRQTAGVLRLGEAFVPLCPSSGTHR